jgi:hypothetical protein
MSYDVEIEIDGASYTGTFTVARRGIKGATITVSSALYGSRTTQLGSSPERVLARMLLGQLVREGLATRRKK